MILGEMEFTGYRNASGQWVSARLVEVDNQLKATRKDNGEELESVKLDVKQLVKKGEAFVLAEDESIAVDGKSYKMSKSRGNVINPDDVVAQYGADSLRLYEMFMGPLEAVKPWSQDSVSGVRGFLDKVWRLMISAKTDDDDIVLSSAVKDVTMTEEQNRIVHKTIKAVTVDIKNLSFNTAIARMMEFANYFGRQETRPVAAMEAIVKLLAPFAPHISEELWQILGHNESVAYASWPTWDEAALTESTLTVAVQINGKMRGKVTMPADATADVMEELAKSDPKIAQWLQDKTIIKKIIVPVKMVNFVVR